MDGSAATEVVWRDEVREAIARLPERQRVALELRERKGLAYEQIAASLGTGSGPVAQLLERARINLYDELRGTPLASVAAPSADCERAMPLIAARQDGELASSSEDAAWLDGHLAGCERCRLGEEQMRDAAAFYGGEAPATVPPVAARARSSEATAVASPTPTGRPHVAVRPATMEDPSTRRPRQAVTRLGAGLAALLLLTGVAVAAVAGGGGGGSGDPAAAKAASNRSHLVSPRAAERARAAHQGKKRHRSRGKSAHAATTAATGLLPEASGSAPTVIAAPLGTGGGNSSAPASGHSPSSGKAAVHPPKQTTASKPAPKPKPAAPESTPSSQPPPEPAPPATTTEAQPPPPAEEADRPGHSGDAPGKAVGRPSAHPAH